MTINFSPLSENDLSLLYRWRNQPEVYRWYGKTPPDMEEIRHTYLPYIRGEKPTRGFIILLNERPIGYIQTYMMSDYPDYEALIGYRETAAMFDIFIGEVDCQHRGYGPEIMRRFLGEIVFPTYPVAVCLIGPEPANTAAIRAYEKVGFNYYTTIMNNDGIEEYIMVLRKADE